MLDKHTIPLLKKPLQAIAIRLFSSGISANQVTLAGFVCGITSVLLIAGGLHVAGLAMLLLNRLADGIDGELARLKSPTDAGAFLDITLDFIFYAIFPLGFAIANPALNALPAAVLIASFVGTGASFLAFSSQAEKRNISHPDFGYKGFYYLNGLAEGTETIVCFALMCLFPQHFSTIALLFAVICMITAINRIVFGYRTLK